MRPVVPQDRAAAAVRAVLALLALLVAVPPWEHPVFVAVLVVGTVAYLGAGLRFGPFAPARRWVADVAEAPLVPRVAAPVAAAVRRGLLLGAVGGLGLLAAVVAIVSTGTLVLAVLPAAVVLGRSVDRFLVTCALRDWERERGVVLCRLAAPTRSGVVLLHETDLERMVAVP